MLRGFWILKGANHDYKHKCSHTCNKYQFFMTTLRTDIPSIGKDMPSPLPADKRPLKSGIIFPKLECEGTNRYEIFTGVLPPKASAVD